MLTIAFLASLLVVTAGEDNSEPVKKIHGVPVPVSYAKFFERLARDRSEVPKEISEALDYFVGEWEGRQSPPGDTPPDQIWLARRASRNCVVVSRTMKSTPNGHPHKSRGKILIGWDAKEERVKYFSTGAGSYDEYISWEIKSPNRWVSNSFKGHNVPLRDILLSKAGPDEFVILRNPVMMAMPSCITLVRVTTSPGYAKFHEQLSRDKSEVPKEISEALEYFAGEWKGKWLWRDSQPHLTWSVRRAAANHLIVSTTETVEWEDRVEARKGRILIGWDSKEKRVKLFSFELRCPSLTEECISWQVSSPNKWVSRTFEGHRLQPPLRETLLEKSEPDEFVIRRHFDMMQPTSGIEFTRVEPAEDAEEGSAGQ